MSMNVPEQMVEVAASLFRRGYSAGTAGNLSVRCEDRVFITPTNSSFGSVQAGEIAEVGLDGTRIGANVPSKEIPFHLGIYSIRPDCRAVVHLHSTYATAVACLAALDCADALAPLTPYYAMRVRRLPVVEYRPPGDARLAELIAEAAAGTDAILLRNHGLVTLGRDLFSAAALAEEVEQQARLSLLLGERARPLSEDEISELRKRFR
jgi:ribulose-5-phosphate 4-epimerase/fuculose-1-phosphate aldolase